MALEWNRVVASTLIRRRAIACLLLVAACGSTASAPVDQTTQLPRDGASYFPPTTWRTAEPQQVGMDGVRISSLVRRLETNEIRGLHALVIVRHGYLVAERYFNGSISERVHTVQSVTKSVTSLVTGIAVDDGALKTDGRIFDVLPRYADLAANDDRKSRVTIGSLLEMRSGINFYESPYPGSPLQRLNDSRDDWVRIALAEPMNAAPGERFQYNSGGVIALAGAVQQATKTSFVDFARTRLFAPIGITTEQWIRSPFDGLPHTGGGLNLRALDLARIGYLVLRDGIWGTKRIVSSAWIRESMRARTVRAAGFGGQPTDYGYLWWLMSIDGDPIYVASGNFNNWLFVVPKHDLVVAVIGQNNDSFASPVVFLFSDILPSIVKP
jgi:CubicO group peptidase (beta-lactamase class C family)